MNTRNPRMIAVLAVLVMAAAVFAAAPPAEKLLPTKVEVKPWSPVPDSLTCVKSSKLEDLYDGGADLYREHGVQEAAQQLYQRRNDIMEITIMSIDSPANAKKFYLYWKKSTTPKIVVKSKHGEAFLSTRNPAAGYVYVGRYLAAVVPAYPGIKARTDTENIIKSLSRKLEKTVKK